jgi:hypothetical protein
MANLEAIQEKIAQLPDAARDELVTFLDYLGYKFSPDDKAYESILQDELRERAQALREGRTETVSSDAAFQRIQEKSGW